MVCRPSRWAMIAGCASATGWSPSAIRSISAEPSPRASSPRSAATSAMVLTRTIIQIDAPINHGNSGGPTFDISGRVVGMNTAIFSPSGGSVGIGFAVPASTIKAVTDELKTSGSISRGWLGVQIQDFTPELASSVGMKDQKGAMVASVVDGSPAARAGLRARRCGHCVERNRGHRFQGADAPGGFDPRRRQGDVHRCSQRRASHAHGDDREARCGSHGLGRTGPGRATGLARLELVTDQSCAAPAIRARQHRQRRGCERRRSRQRGGAQRHHAPATSSSASDSRT